VCVFSHKRFNGLMDPSWGSTPFPGHMLPGDRSHWSNEDGTVSVEVVESELHKLNAPVSFQWAGEWEIDFDYTPCDDQVVVVAF
jgi:hypothetical protein